MLSKAIVFCVSIAVASAAVALLPSQPKPEKFQNVEGCYVPELDVVIKLNSSVYSDDCRRYHCGDSFTSIYTCGAMAVDLSNSPSCYVFEDKQKPYPDCCLQVKCSDDSN